tara:strand:+ start:160 stop:498 length:339 start_codon:yes stop_codon:yes gene_type:complete
MEYVPKKKKKRGRPKGTKNKKKTEAKLNKVMRGKRAAVRRATSVVKRAQRRLAPKDRKMVKKRTRKPKAAGSCGKAGQVLRLSPCSNRGPASQHPACKAAGRKLRNCRKKKK